MSKPDEYLYPRLPTELYSNILGYLDYKCILRCMQVCSLFRDIITETAHLQLIIELAVAGKASGNNNDASSSNALLQLLKKYQSAWNSVKWTRESRIPMKDGGLWELFGGVLGQSSESDSLFFYQLPSDLRNIEAREWTLRANDIDVHVRDFAMEPSQDLLVLVEAPNWSLTDDKLEYRVHLRLLSTGKPHPQALGGPILRLRQKTRDIIQSYIIQIFGGLISVTFEPTSAETELAIWEWKTNTLLADIDNDEILSSTFISDSWMLLGLMDAYGGPVLAAFYFREAWTEHDDEDAFYQNTVKFAYPEFREDAFINDIDIRCDPGAISQGDAVPFSQNSKDFIIVVNIWFIADEAFKCLTHFIPSSSILEHCKAFDIIPWSDWAPKKTRLIFPTAHPSDVWVCYVYGTRVVIPEPVPDSKNSYSIRVYDFNQLPIRRGAQYSEIEAPSGIDRSTTVIGGGTAFEGDAMTCLPFSSHVIHLEDAHAHCSVLCSEDQIIVVDSECREYRALVF